MTADERRSLADAFALQALGSRGLGSDLYGALCDRLAADVLAEGPTWTLLAPHASAGVGQAYVLRVLGGAHRLALAGAAPSLAAHFPSTGGDGDADGAWRALRDVLSDPPPALLDALTRPPQTNEVGRSASLIGGFLLVARESGLPLRVLEIGSSAGLNLRFDHFRYAQDDVAFGPADARVRFGALWPARVPPFEVPMTVASRRGCDLDPIDVTTTDGRLTLLSYVWPDQLDRFERTSAAIDVAREVPAIVDRADAPAWLRSQLAHATPDVATVVFHSIMWQYLNDATRQAVDDALAEAGRRATPEAPLARLRLEPDDGLLDGSGGASTSVFPRVRLATWPDGGDRLLANGAWHLGEVEWFG